MIHMIIYNIHLAGPRNPFRNVSVCRSGVESLTLGQLHSFVEIDHEIFSLVIILPLIQEGLLSVTIKSVRRVLLTA